MTVNELAELLTPIGCDPLASRTTINNGVRPDNLRRVLKFVLIRFSEGGTS